MATFVRLWRHTDNRPSFLRKYVGWFLYILSLLMFISIKLKESKTSLTVLLRGENVSSEKARKKVHESVKWQVLRLTILALFAFFSEAFCFAVVVKDNFSQLFSIRSETNALWWREVSKTRAELLTIGKNLPSYFHFTMYKIHVAGARGIRSKSH